MVVSTVAGISVQTYPATAVGRRNQSPHAATRDRRNGRAFLLQSSKNPDMGHSPGWAASQGEVDTALFFCFLCFSS